MVQVFEDSEDEGDDDRSVDEDREAAAGKAAAADQKGAAKGGDDTDLAKRQPSEVARSVGSVLGRDALKHSGTDLSNGSGEDAIDAPVSRGTHASC